MTMFSVLVQEGAVEINSLSLRAAMGQTLSRTLFMTKMNLEDLSFTDDDPIFATINGREIAAELAHLGLDGSGQVAMAWLWDRQTDQYIATAAPLSPHAFVFQKVVSLVEPDDSAGNAFSAYLPAMMTALYESLNPSD